MINYGPAELAAAFRTVRNNTLEIAKSIPEDKYDFAPAPGTRTVRDTLTHIAYLNMLHYDFHRDRKISTLAGYDFDVIIGKQHDAQSKKLGKDELIKLLESRGEEYAKWMESLSTSFLNETYTDYAGKNPKSRFEQIMSAKEHEMHHRGQLMVVQRMLGITPHLTQAAQQRAAARAAAKAAKA